MELNNHYSSKVAVLKAWSGTAADVGRKLFGRNYSGTKQDSPLWLPKGGNSLWSPDRHSLLCAKFAWVQVLWRLIKGAGGGNGSILEWRQCPPLRTEVKSLFPGTLTLLLSSSRPILKFFQLDTQCPWWLATWASMAYGLWWFSKPSWHFSPPFPFCSPHMYCCMVQCFPEVNDETDCISATGTVGSTLMTILAI